MRHLSIKRYRRIIIASGIGVIATTSLLGYGFVKNQNQRADADQVKTELVKVSSYGKDFNGSSEKRLKALKKLETEYAKYLKSTTVGKNGEITYKFETLITREKRYFKNKADSIIRENETNNLKKETKDTLQSKVANLIRELKDVKSEKGIVFTSKKVKDYTEEINAFLNKYNSKLKKINNKREAKASSTAITAAESSATLATNQSDSVNTANSTAAVKSSTETSSTGTYSSAENSKTYSSAGTAKPTVSRTYTTSSTKGYRATSTYKAPTYSSSARSSSDAQESSTTTDYAGQTSDTQHYVGTSTEGESSITVNNNYGESNGADFK
ncbi:hypothetical protein [Liquorilactobacillus mali]|uniref:hypothetical protein n=1 Tax=Liquorilactobacillus mali TaxID=1618 RepID=UPI0007054072|nr:hypothetical protein [Liquorilactobacillus mali]